MLKNRCLRIEDEKIREYFPTGKFSHRECSRYPYLTLSNMRIFANLCEYRPKKSISLLN